MGANFYVHLVIAFALAELLGPGRCSVPFRPQQKSQSEITQNLFVTLVESPLEQINDFAEDHFNSQSEQASALVHKLQAFSQASQAPILLLLKAMGVKAEPFWLTNSIFLRNVDPAVLKALKELPGVKEIVGESVLPLPPVFNAAIGRQPDGPEWHVTRVKADDVWEDSQGENIRVAIIDTGVRATHYALERNYVGTEEHGWYDPILFSKEPSDYHGHGSHVTGIITGENGIGIAPGAQWMACRGCMVSGCLQHALIACGQYALCPNDPREGKKNCTGLPHVVNNSWGSGGGQEWFRTIVAAWLKAGIKPFFAFGNNGPYCESGMSPGDYEEVVAVGSTDRDDRLSNFSSRGPVVKLSFIPGEDGADEVDDGKWMNPMGLAYRAMNLGKHRIYSDIIKPDICAPGYLINSADMLTDGSYKVLSGTSMATPVVVGVAALLLSKKPDMTLGELKHLLFHTAEQYLKSSNSEQCGSTPEDTFPNSMYGHGRVDALKAYQKLARRLKSGKVHKEKTTRKPKKAKEESNRDDPFAFPAFSKNAYEENPFSNFFG